MNSSNNNLELVMLHNSIISLNNYVRTVNASIDYLNNATANIRHMQEHINYNYRINNHRIMTQNITPYTIDPTTNNSNNNGNSNHNSNHNSNRNSNSNSNRNSNHNSNHNSNSNSNTELTNEYFEELSLANLKNIINNNITEYAYCTLCEPLNDSCSITHEEFVPEARVSKINSCEHIFNSKAINDWLVIHQTCPNCRYNILTNSNIICYSDLETGAKYFLNIDELIQYFCFIHQ